MAYGLRLRNAAGNITLDMTDSITRVLGAVNTGIADGSISVPAFATGRPWFVEVQTNSNVQGRYTPASIVASGTTLSWNFGGIPSYARVPVTIRYGVY